MHKTDVLVGTSIPPPSRRVAACRDRVLKAFIPDNQRITNCKIRSIRRCLWIICITKGW